MNIISLAIPVFFAMIAVEWLIAHQRKLPFFKLNDSLCNLFCGAGSQIIGAASAVVTYGIYTWTYDTLTPIQWTEGNVWEWVLCVVLVDLGYYVFHRASHRVQIFWACHVVHHQSEEYNLSVALRQSWFGGFLSWVFYTPLVLVGFSPAMVLGAKLINLLYQFWVHTRLIDRVGIFELFFVTPSNHRVHHGCDERSLDTNYGGIFIVWDRMFGTFRDEATEPPYGTVKPLASFNPLRANLEGWSTIGKLYGEARGFKEKLYAFFAPPEWYPQKSDGYGGLLEQVESREKYSPRLSVQQGIYIVAHFTAASLVLALWLNWKDPSALELKSLAGLTLLLGFTAWGTWLSNFQSWKVWECARLLCMTLLLVWLLGPAYGLALGALELAWFMVVQSDQASVGASQ